MSTFENNNRFAGIISYLKHIGYFDFFCWPKIKRFSSLMERKHKDEDLTQISTDITY